MATNLVPGDFRLTEGVVTSKVLDISVVRALTFNSVRINLRHYSGKSLAVKEEHLEMSSLSETDILLELEHLHIWKARGLHKTFNRLLKECAVAIR